jgi:tetratricopeptide (TPR) repeat protein
LDYPHASAFSRTTRRSRSGPWFEYLAGNAPRAAELLAQAAVRQKGDAKALSLYYRGAVLNRLGRYEEAVIALDQALAERENIILARQEKGEAFWKLGRKEEAIATWSDAIRAQPAPRVDP